MKNFFIGVVVLMFVASGTVCAQSLSSQQKEQQALVNASKKELNAKVSKAARKEAKNLIKAGWKTAPGALPIDKQLDRSYTMQYQLDSNGDPLYIMSEGMSIGGNYDAAKMQALELAKQNLAGQIQTEVMALVESTVGNKQLGEDDAASITKSVMAGKSLISQSIGRVVPIVEAYQVVNGNNRNVLVRIAYSMDMAKSVAKKAIKEDLEKRGEELHGKLDELLGW